MSGNIIQQLLGSNVITRRLHGRRTESNSTSSREIAELVNSISELGGIRRKFTPLYELASSEVGFNWSGSTPSE
jgi:hypothetical protein